MKSFDELTDEEFEKLGVLDRFDWDEAHELFKKMGWAWYGLDDTPGMIPSAKDLRDLAESLIHDCIRTGSSNYSCGRVSVVIVDDMVSISIGDPEWGNLSEFQDIVDEVNMEKAIG